MFIRPASTLAALGLFCSMVTDAVAEVPSANVFSPPANIEQRGNYSILSKEQVKEKRNKRFFINQDVAHTNDTDPIQPYKANPLYSFIGGEYFFTPEFSLGAVLTYTYEKDRFSNLPVGQISSNEVDNVTGLLPYINYLATPSWLLTVQAGGYVEDYKETTVTTSGTVLTRNQVFTPDVEGYATWIGPDQKYTASVRAGAYYVNQRFRSVIDSTGFFYQTRHFESAAVAASARLKYFPDDTFWNVFLHLEADYRIFAGARPDIYNPNGLRQNLLWQVGPGVHFKLNETWELRVLALHTVGFGYGKEERIGIRLRAAF